MTLIEATTMICAPIEACFDLSLSIDLELEAGSAYNLRAVSGVTQGSIGLHERVCWQARHFGVRVAHESEITQIKKPAFFQDTMIRGVFKTFQHDHFFRSFGSKRTEMKDSLRFSMPFWLLGMISERLIVRSRVMGLLADRNRLVKRHAEAAAK